MIGTGANPNVAAAIVIGIEPNWTRADRRRDREPPASRSRRSRSRATATSRPCAAASLAAQELLQHASEREREPVELAELTFSIKCGESDTTTGLASCPTVGGVVDRLVDAGATVLFGETSELTGGEHLIADRMRDPELRERFLRHYRAYVGAIESSGADLLGSQPTQGNIAGGLSTIEEKALGNIQKTGTKPVVGVLEPAVAPATRARPLLHGQLVGGRRVHHADGRRAVRSRICSRRVRAT